MDPYWCFSRTPLQTLIVNRLNASPSPYVLPTLDKPRGLALLFSRGVPPSVCWLRQISADVAAGLAHVHAQDIIHGDVRLDSIALGDGGRGQISGFVDARTPQHPAVEEYWERWAAPEVKASGLLSSNTDVWSFGATLLEVFNQGRAPLDCLHDYAVTEAIVRQTHAPPQGCPPDVWPLIAACLAHDAARRPPMADLTQRLAAARRQQCRFVDCYDHDRRCVWRWTAGLRRDDTAEPFYCTDLLPCVGCETVARRSFAAARAPVPIVDPAASDAAATLIADHALAADAGGLLTIGQSSGSYSAHELGDETIECIDGLDDIDRKIDEMNRNADSVLEPHRRTPSSSRGPANLGRLTISRSVPNFSMPWSPDADPASPPGSDGRLQFSADGIVRYPSQPNLAALSTPLSSSSSFMTDSISSFPQLDPPLHRDGLPGSAERLEFSPDGSTVLGRPPGPTSSLPNLTPVSSSSSSASWLYSSHPEYSPALERPGSLNVPHAKQLWESVAKPLTFAMPFDSAVRPAIPAPRHSASRPTAEAAPSDDELMDADDSQDP